MEHETKYHYAREILYELKVCRAITADVYLLWLDKIDDDENNNATKPEDLEG